MKFKVISILHLHVLYALVIANFFQSGVCNLHSYEFLFFGRIGKALVVLGAVKFELFSVVLLVLLQNVSSYGQTVGVHVPLLLPAFKFR